MKFTKKREVEEVFEAGKWGESEPGCVAVRWPNRLLSYVKHEGAILDSWPVDLKAYVRREVCSNRELAENETRRGGSPSEIGVMSVDGDVLVIDFGGCKVRRTRDVVTTDHDSARRLAFLDARLPADKIRFDCGALGTMTREGDGVLIEVNGKQCRKFTFDSDTDGSFSWHSSSTHPLKITDPIQRQKVRDFAAANKKPLKPNQLETPGGHRAELRWSDGKPQINHNGSGWVGWCDVASGTKGWQADAQAWFETNKPGPINDGAGWRLEGGRELTFRMRDDGEAEMVNHDGSVDAPHTGKSVTFPTVAFVNATAAAKAWRDRERAKWTFDASDGAVYVLFEGKTGFGGYYPDQGASSTLQRQPTWVRIKAETLYREMQAKKAPEWRAEWDTDGKSVHVLANGNCGAYFGRNGWNRFIVGFPAIPSNVADDAVALFRANYKLKSDEQWDGDTVVKLPENQYRDSQGRVWTFEVREDGEVNALIGSRVMGNTDQLGPFGYEDTPLSAYAYRDLIASRRPSYIPEGAEWGWTIDAKGRRVGMWVEQDCVRIHDPDCNAGYERWTWGNMSSRLAWDRHASLTTRMFDDAKALWERVHPPAKPSTIEAVVQQLTTPFGTQKVVVAFDAPKGAKVGDVVRVTIEELKK